MHSAPAQAFLLPLVMRNREIAEAALRPSTLEFTHGDLQCDQVFVDGDEVSGVLDWSEADVKEHNTHDACDRLGTGPSESLTHGVLMGEAL